MDSLSDLRNLGPKSAKMLCDVGITTPSALRDAGAFLAYRMLKHRFPNKVSLLFLYALDGALQNRHWNSYSPEEKARLKEEAAGELETEYLG